MLKTIASLFTLRSASPIARLRSLPLAAVMLLLALPAAPALAQTPFSAAARVNDDVVTYYEVSQRRALLEILNAPADVRDQALETLIDERLQQQAAVRMGLAATPEQIESGVSDFAGRVQLSAEQLINNISAEGIAPETFRDFITAGVSWRNVVRARFGPQASLTRDEVERALAAGNTTAGMRMLLAELVMPANEQNAALLTQELARLSDQVDGSFDAFSDAARRFSAAPTASAGGLTGWRPVSEIPAPLVALLSSMSPGQVTDPIPLGNAIALFQFRGLEEIVLGAPDVSAIDYLTVAIPGGRSPAGLAEAARLRAAADSCDDMYGVLPGGFERNTVPVRDIPQDVAGALAQLDDNEMSTAVTRADGQVLLLTMLCERELSVADDARQRVEAQLFQQRLDGYAQSFLSELRAEAIIIYDGQ